MDLEGLRQIMDENKRTKSQGSDAGTKLMNAAQTN